MTPLDPPHRLSRTRHWMWQDPQVREFLCYCAPALLLGFVLRALMTWQMPYGYMQFDSADFLLTANRYLSRGVFAVHSKRTFLVPLLYLLPFLLKVPALIIIPIAQHLLGLAVVFMTGLLTRLWVPAWRWVIVPVTLLAAANPNLLWFEHALMSESVYLFCVVGLVLAAALFTQRSTTPRFSWLLIALFFAAAARPEGRLLLGFGFFLVLLVDWGYWKTMGLRMACLVALAGLTLPMTRTGQAGQLLYATVLPLAPDVSRVDPEFGRQVIPLRDELRAKGRVNTELQSLEQKLTDMTGAYLEGKGNVHPDTNTLCRRLAVEACLHQPWALPILAARKFLLSTKGDVSVGYDEPRLQQKLNVGFNRKEMLDILSRGLVGEQLNGPPAVTEFVAAHYRPLSWYPALEAMWRQLTLRFDVGAEPSTESQIPPWPAFFLLSLVGMAIAMAAPGSFRKLHLAWVLSLLGLWFAVELTGVVNPRYRFVFEPFCLLYVFLGLAWMGRKFVTVCHSLVHAAGKSEATVAGVPGRIAPASASSALTKTLR